jgi:hypothetical protein
MPAIFCTSVGVANRSAAGCARASAIRCSLSADGLFPRSSSLVCYNFPWRPTLSRSASKSMTTTVLLSAEDLERTPRPIEVGGYGARHFDLSSTLSDPRAYLPALAVPAACNR